jgi:hypothetical protein
VRCSSVLFCWPQMLPVCGVMAWLKRPGPEAWRFGFDNVDESSYIGSRCASFRIGVQGVES